MLVVNYLDNSPNWKNEEFKAAALEPLVEVIYILP